MSIRPTPGVQESRTQAQIEIPHPATRMTASIEIESISCSRSPREVAERPSWPLAVRRRSRRPKPHARTPPRRIRFPPCRWALGLLVAEIARLGGWGAAALGGCGQRATGWGSGLRLPASPELQRRRLRPTYLFGLGPPLLP